MQNVLEILSWYKNNSRDLPWRNSQDPYKIWLSEIILQQTQVVQGIKYYYKFISEYPDIKALAEADEQEVLKNWQGLGYYSRARNLLKTARIISNDFNGVFPDSYEVLISLPGIGEYTASAILSFAFKQPYPALDGNVYRVLSRWQEIKLPINEPRSKPVFMEYLNEMIKDRDPTIFNNAMMELGALVCKPENPLCSGCPISLDCLARLNSTIMELPVKTKKLKKRKRYFYFFYILNKNSFYIEQRKGSDIWQNLYQLPLIESESALKPEGVLEAFKEQIADSTALEFKIQTSFKHILTHQDIFATFIQVDCKQEVLFKRQGLIEVDDQNYLNYPVPVLVEKFLLSL